MIGNERSFTWALDGSLSEKMRHRGEADLARTVSEWRQLGIDLVLVVDSGQGMALEFLARDIVLLGMAVHIIPLGALTEGPPTGPFQGNRVLVLHAESSEELARRLKGDPVLDVPPYIVRSAPRQPAQPPVRRPPLRPQPTEDAGLSLPRPPAQTAPPVAPVTQSPRPAAPAAAPVMRAPAPPAPQQAAVTPPAAEPPRPVQEIHPATAIQTAPAVRPAAAPKFSRSEAGISRWNIRVKTIALLSALIVTALGVMIFWASYQFTQDMGRSIESNMQKLNEVVGQKVQVILEQTRFGAGLISAQKRDDGVRLPGAAAVDLFRGNQDLIAILATEPGGDSLKISRTMMNREQMELSGLTEEDLSRLLSLNGKALAEASTGATVVANVSPGFRLPLLAMSFPSQNESGTILVLVLNARRISEAFLADDSTLTFMVDRNGTVVAHPDANAVLNAAQVTDLPIFTDMMKSPLEKGAVRYSHNGKLYRGSYKKLPLGGLGVISSVEEDVAFAEVSRIRNRNLMVLGIVLSAAILVGYFFARSLAIPLRELVGATRRVEAEDYTVHVEPRSRDEVGALATSFNKMVNGLAERERMKDAFGRFVNKEVAERALRGELKLGGEKKECAVFFSDLRGFTAMSEKMQPEEVVEYLNRYFTLMVDCVDKSGGIVDKFIGDAVMATWGSVSSRGNDTANAIEGALMMRNALMEFNRHNEEHNLPLARFGCGINTGEVISGQIGTSKKMEFTVIGDAVNLASRIESLNKPFATDILVSQDAYERVQGMFEVVKMPAIKVKGKSQPQTIYCVLGKVDDPTRPQDLAGLRRLTGIDWAAKTGADGTFEDKGEEKYEIIEG